MGERREERVKQGQLNAATPKGKEERTVDATEGGSCEPRVVVRAIVEGRRRGQGCQGKRRRRGCGEGGEGGGGGKIGGEGGGGG